MTFPHPARTRWAGPTLRPQPGTCPQLTATPADPHAPINTKVAR
ncbi:hypothetical protein [Micromonospora sp. NPDC005806]